MIFSTSSLARGSERGTEGEERSRTLKTIQREKRARKKGPERRGTEAKPEGGARGNRREGKETAKIPKSLASRDVKD